jgi:hypothetical protein
MGPPALLPIREDGVLRIFIVIKSSSPRPGSNPQLLDPVASTLTTAPPRRLDTTWLQFHFVNALHACFRSHSAWWLLNFRWLQRHVLLQFPFQIYIFSSHFLSETCKSFNSVNNSAFTVNNKPHFICTLLLFHPLWDFHHLSLFVSRTSTFEPTNQFSPNLVWLLLRYGPLNVVRSFSSDTTAT